MKTDLRESLDLIETEGKMEETDTFEKENKESKKSFVLAKKWKKHRKRAIAYGVAFLAIAALVGFVCMMAFRPESKADTKMLIATLEKSGELTATKLHYKGIVEYKDKGVLLINKSDFLMVYEADLRAGIDIEDVKVTANDVTKTIKVEIPEAKILSVEVNADTIKYYDEGFSLFNTDAKEDGNEAIELAEQSAKEEAAEIGILESANEHAEILIKGILVNSIPDGYTIETKLVKAKS